MLNIVAIASSDMQTILIIVSEIKNYSRLIAKKMPEAAKSIRPADLLCSRPA